MQLYVSESDDDVGPALNPSLIGEESARPAEAEDQPSLAENNNQSSTSETLPARKRKNPAPVWSCITEISEAGGSKCKSVQVSAFERRRYQLLSKSGKSLDGWISYY